MGKQLLIENYTVKNSEVKPIPLTESTLMVEGTEYKCTAAYAFPISRPGEVNLNDRIYEALLWEGVIKRNEGEGAFGLCDHPSDGGSVKDAFCVWHNVRFSEDRKLMVADAYLFGNWGQQAKEAIDAGGSLGMSTVGYGEFKKDGRTIDETTYELKRPADWVLDPSYGVFGKDTDDLNKENEKPSSEDIVSEEVEKISEDRMEKQKTKLEENIFRVQIEGMIKDVKKSDDLKFRISESKKAKTFLEDGLFPELNKELDAIVSEAEASIHELADKGSKLEETETQKTEAEAKVTTLTEENEALKIEKEDLEKVAEEATVLADSLKVVIDESSKTIADIENKLQTSFTAEEVLAINEKHEADMKEIIENTFSTEEVAKLQEEMATLMAENDSLKVEAEKSDEEKEKEKKAKENDDANKDKAKTDQAAKDKADKADDAEDKEKKDKEKKKNENTQAVVAYYEKMRGAHPAMVKIKEEILGCKTLIEAQKKFINLKAVVTESSYKSSYTMPDKPVVEVSEAVLNRKLVKPTSRLRKREGWS